MPTLLSIRKKSKPPDFFGRYRAAGMSLAKSALPLPRPHVDAVL
jgi:hypothetical protein